MGSTTTKRPPLSRRTAYADLPERLTVYEFVRVSGVGRATVYDAVRRGRLPSIRIGRRVLIPRTALLMDSEETRADAPPAGDDPRAYVPPTDGPLDAIEQALVRMFVRIIVREIRKEEAGRCQSSDGAGLNTGGADDHIITTHELLERIPLDRSTVWRMTRDGRFPKPIQLTRSRIGWRWSAIAAWLAERETDPITTRAYFGREENNRRTRRVTATRKGGR